MLLYSRTLKSDMGSQVLPGIGHVLEKHLHAPTYVVMPLLTWLPLCNSNSRGSQYISDVNPSWNTRNR